MCYTGECRYESRGFGTDGDCTVYDGVYPPDAWYMQDHEPTETVHKDTCSLESMHGYTDAFTQTRYSVELSCHTIDDWGESEPPFYCPYCGRKVVL